MALLLNGILGDVRGKVANVVGGGWKGKNYIRKFVIPANPSTDPQVEQRSKMSLCVAYGKQLCGAIFQPYLDKFVKGMSGFNDFVSRNCVHFADPLVMDSVRLVTGPLYAASWVLIAPSAGDDEVTVTWDTDLGSNGLATDSVVVVVYNRNELTFGFSALNKTRGDGATGYVIDLAMTAADVIDGHVLFVKKSDSGIVQLIGQNWDKGNAA